MKNPKEGLEVEEIVSKSDVSSSRIQRRSLSQSLVFWWSLPQFWIKYGYMIPQEKKLLLQSSAANSISQLTLSTWHFMVTALISKETGRAIAKSYGSTKSGNLAKSIFRNLLLPFGWDTEGSWHAQIFQGWRQYDLSCCYRVWSATAMSTSAIPKGRNLFWESSKGSRQWCR